MIHEDDGNLRSFKHLLEDDAPAFLDAPPDAIRQSIAALQDCLPPGARLVLSGVMDREGFVSDYSDDPMFHVEISLYGSPKP